MITHKYYKYTPQFKHNVLEEYRPGVILCSKLDLLLQGNMSQDALQLILPRYS